jgi:D-serine deaminase-like pyridoxal phosphate-dependent protein
MKPSLNIKTPVLLLNETICRQNIKRMSEKAVRNKVKFRPHFKTHSSTEIGNWFRETGVDAITVSSVSMASFFSENDWNDITVAFPVNIREIEDINELLKRTRLNLLVENQEATKCLGKMLTGRTGIFLKVDSGYHRSGIAPEDHKLIEEIFDLIDQYHHLDFMGFLTHAGQTYKSRCKEEVLRIHEETIRIMTSLKNKYQERYNRLILSVGDTPSCSVAEDFSDVDEIRPGNFVFYDLMQGHIGSCDYSDIAVAMACPVVSKHSVRNEIVIYGGAVHFSKEHLMSQDGTPFYGLITEPVKGGWSNPVEGVWLSSLSQEHGIIKSENRRFFDQVRVGDLVLVLPVHSCLTANLMKKFMLMDGRIIG